MIGPWGDIRFHNATIAWAVFYSLMAKVNRNAMKQSVIRTQLQAVCDLFDLSFHAFFNNNGSAELEVFRAFRNG